MRRSHCRALKKHAHLRIKCLNGGHRALLGSAGISYSKSEDTETPQRGLLSTMINPHNVLSQSVKVWPSTTVRLSFSNGLSMSIQRRMRRRRRGAIIYWDSGCFHLPFVAKTISCTCLRNSSKTSRWESEQRQNIEQFMLLSQTRELWHKQSDIHTCWSK